MTPNSGVNNSGGINRTYGATNSNDAARDMNTNGTANRSTTTGTESIQPAPGVSQPESIIDQPNTPDIPMPGEPNSDPATMNLQKVQ
ncbi:hypothetical protein JYU29_01175 [Tianweitania sp. BSSL-BM11]|uniref:Uncharacterized protein n=1 Tax=Tianweitania aestuarii TaxID=2814886 RepID=A0ABS5RQH9_9HYPH|nr:hypothetical protein [Tianweitania aestuarii]MBS9719295.1 hypothetical protein [Tianweitania aestuarii]